MAASLFEQWRSVELRLAQKGLDAAERELLSHPERMSPERKAACEKYVELRRDIVEAIKRHGSESASA